MPLSVSTWLIILLFPAIVLPILLFPIFAVIRFCFIRKNGVGDYYKSFKKRSFRWLITVILVSYIVVVTGIFFPSLLPTINNFFKKGYLAGIVPMLLVDLIFGGLFSVTRALASFEKRQKR